MSHDPRRGRAIVIAGPDGAGKTTLADALEDRLKASQGDSLAVRRHACVSWPGLSDADHLDAG